MDFQAGDQVVHLTYGPAEVIGLDRKEISGRTTLCYVVRVYSQTSNMILWVPVDNAGKCSLRQPTPAKEFAHLFTILSSPGAPLSPDRQERKMYLLARLREGTLAAICEVIRDLALFSRTKKLNDQDASIMERAQDYLIKEWRLALAVPASQAELELKHMLGMDAGGGHKLRSSPRR